jgi:energy-coupling factor transport system ATP-binding protein
MSLVGSGSASTAEHGSSQPDTRPARTVTAASPSLVELEGVSFRYGRASEPALRNVTVAIEPGEVLLVAGPSGCGKSTLIRVMNGLIPHAYSGELVGEVRVEGRSTIELRLRDIARTVGTVLQDPAKQIVGSTTEAELAFGPENIGIDRAEIMARMALVADRAGIRGLLGRDTAALSGGERQLLAIGGILMMGPRLYVVDEPLASLDPATAGRLLAILRDLADHGDSVVIVEHRVEEALGLRPDRVLYLEQGETRYLGDVDGFLRVADPGAVKLPFEVILARMRSRAAARTGQSTSDVVNPTATEIELAEVLGPPRLEFRGVSAGYDGREVLHEVDTRLGARDTVAVLGPNGSGKTTLFRTAMKLLMPTAGDILVDGTETIGRSVADLATVFGYVFQSPSQMLFARTVREELLFGPRNLGADPAGFGELVSEVLGRVGLDDLEGIASRPPLTLSFGQQKRLALAIALALRPRTLMLDEPSAGQDHRHAATFMADVRSIPGLESIYMVTHDVDLALVNARRILLFRDGRIVGDGTPTQIIEDLDLWRSCNLRETSLIRAHARWASLAPDFVDAETLASRVVKAELGRSELGGWKGVEAIDRS